MSGAWWGLVLGLGLALIWWSFWPQPDVPSRTKITWWSKVQDDLVLSGIRGLGVRGLLTSCAVLALVTTALFYVLTAVAPIAVAFGLMSAVAPIAYVRARARKRRAGLREVWPDAVDHLASAVRAGLALPEALVQLADRGPRELRDAFAAFEYDYRASGHFSSSLDRLKQRMADPVADRLVEALRIARDVGGSDLGRLLRTLSTFLREDAHARAEMEARQSWTVNAARLAMGAPWAVLLLLATRGTALEAYQSPAGVVILVIGAVTSIAAYLIMLRIARLPEEARVLR